jgi:hypothetical protein
METIASLNILYVPNGRYCKKISNKAKKFYACENLITKRYVFT